MGMARASRERDGISDASNIALEQIVLYCLGLDCHFFSTHAFFCSLRVCGQAAQRSLESESAHDRIARYRSDCLAVLRIS